MRCNEAFTQNLFLLLQMIMLEGAKATTETVDALRTGASAMKAMQKATYDYFYLPLWFIIFQNFVLAGSFNIYKKINQSMLYNTS